MNRPVCVSIGLPVFNAERYIRSSLEATLCQSFADFELIISDNASTDDTFAICEKYARMDDRIRLIRQPENCGVNINHQIVFREASGEYFRWASADDIPSPMLVKHAVEMMRANEHLAAYIPDTVNIDAKGNQVGHLQHTLDLRSDRAEVRAEAVLTRNYQMIFDQGLMRRSVVKTTSQNWTYFGWDFVLLFELALRGQLSNVEGPLLYRRLHEESTARATRRVAEVREWVDPTLRSRILLPHWKWTAERVRAAVRAPLTRAEQARVLRLVLRHARTIRHALWRDIVLSAKLLIGKTDEYPF